MRLIGKWFQYSIVAQMALSLVACTSMEVIKPPKAERIKEEISVGDDVRILTRTGDTLELEITMIGRDSLQGKHGGRSRAVPYGEIARLEVEETNWVATLLVAGVVGYLLFSAVIVDSFHKLAGSD